MSQGGEGHNTFSGSDWTPLHCGERSLAGLARCTPCIGSRPNDNARGFPQSQAFSNVTEACRPPPCRRRNASWSAGSVAAATSPNADPSTWIDFQFRASRTAAPTPFSKQAIDSRGPENKWFSVLRQGRFSSDFSVLVFPAHNPRIRVQNPRPRPTSGQVTETSKTLFNRISRIRASPPAAFFFAAHGGVSPVVLRQANCDAGWQTTQDDFPITVVPSVV